MALGKTWKVDGLMSRILKGVLHNESDNSILITISDKVRVETLKKIYNILLDEEIKNPEKEPPDCR